MSASSTATQAPTSSATSSTQVSTSSFDRNSATTSGAAATVTSTANTFKLTPGAKAGIGVGTVLGVACILLLSVLIFMMRKRQRQQNPPPGMPDTAEEGHVKQDFGLLELETRQQDTHHEMDGRGVGDLLDPHRGAFYGPEYARELG